jgi:uncharacterized protein YbjT (DUF2867 family)
MYLVTGATGNAGGELVRTLAGTGEPVRALVRDPARADLPAGVDVVVGDLNRPESVAAALGGVRGVFLLAGYDRMPDTLAELQRAGVERVVLLSASSVLSTDGDENAVSAYHRASEAAVRESGLAWTFLRPHSFMSNALRWVEQLRAGDVVREEFGDVAVAAIDPADIAAVAAAALTGEGHAGRAYRLTGPEALRPADRVRILGAALGRPLRFEPIPDDVARKEMSAAMPAKYVDAFFSFFVDGTLDESPVLPTVQEVLGRPPRTFAQWAEAHVDAFSRTA